MSDDLYDGIMEAVEARRIMEVARDAGIRPPFRHEDAPEVLREVPLTPVAAIRIAAEHGLNEIRYPAKPEFAAKIAGYDKKTLMEILESKGYLARLHSENFEQIFIMW